MNNNNQQSEGITWISSQSLIQLRMHASSLLLSSSKIHAKQGGAYLSSFKGRGMEFDESRIYQAGDDIRNMDWRVTARTGTAHTKVFREERERPVLLWLDLNTSMMFATRNKFKAVIATELATLIAWSAAKNNDRVGGLIFSSEEHIEIKPRRGKNSVLDFIGRCTKHCAWKNSLQENTDDRAMHGEHRKRDMAAAVLRLQKVTHPGSLIFMVSDFHHMDEKAFAYLASIARNNDIVLINISDPFERDLPISGNYRLSDGENEMHIQATDKKIRRDYQQRYQTQQEQLETFCRQHRIYMVSISTGEDAFDQFNNGFGINASGGSGKTSRNRRSVRNANRQPEHQSGQATASQQR